METKLLPCPFCGWEAKLYKVFISKAAFVSCKNCEASSPLTTEAAAIETWNSRAWTVAGNNAEVLGDVIAGLFRDLMQADPDTARTWALGWPELFGREETDADGA